MADTRVVIDVDINTSPAAQGLRDLQQRFNAFTSALNKNNATQAAASRQYADQLMNLVNSGKFFTAEMVRMQTAAGRLDKTLAKGQATMGQYFSARFIKNSNAAAQVLSLANARAAALQTQFIATSGAANGMRDAIAIRPYEAFNSALAVSTQKLAIHRAMLMQATTHMINFGKNTQWAGRQLMVGFTVPLTIFGGVAGKVFRELEEQAINFKKVYGDIFTTEAETQEALDAVKELSMEFTKYGIAVKDTMELAGVAAQSGLRNAELMAATTQATRLATLGQMEQAEAMKTIISLQTAFKTSNEGLAESVDFLNIIENQTVLALQDVAGAIPRVAPVIQGLGGDVKDLAVLLVAMKEGGVTAGEGANALKSSLGRLIVPTKRAKEMASDFGINLQAIVENNRGELLPMIMELGNAMESLGDLERQQLLTTIFGKFQYARIGALFDNITRDSSQAARAMDLMGLSAAELGEIAEKELGVVEQSVGARFTAAMERAKVAIAPLGEAFLELSIPVINFVAQLVEKFNALPDFAKKFAVFGSVLVGVVIPVGTMFLGLLMNLIGTLIKFGAIIGIAFKGFTSGGIKGAIQAVSQALNYMSLEEIDAANAAQQLGQSTQIVNAAFRDQVGDAAAATAAIEALGLQYAQLVIRMREAAALSGAAGPFAVPGAAMGKATAATRAGQAVRRNKGGPIPFASGDTVPGVGNRDTVPAILTPGEFVVNKTAAAQNRGLLESINNGDIQKLNKGGGVAVPGRMLYGDYGGLSADALEAKALQQMNANIGTSNVSSQMAGARSTTPSPTMPRAAGRLGIFSVTQAKFLQLVGNVLSRKTGASRAINALLGMGVDVTASARGNLGFFTKYNQQLRPGSQGVKAADLLADLTTGSDSFVPIREQVKTWNKLNPSKPVNAQDIIDDFIRTLRQLDDDVILRDTQVTQFYRDAFKGNNSKSLLAELKKPYVVDTSGLKGLIEPALRNANYTPKPLYGPEGTSTVKMRMKKGVLTAQYGDKDGKILRTETVSLKKGEYIQDGSNPPNIYMLDDDGVLINLRHAIGELGYSTAKQNPYGYKSTAIRSAKPAGEQFAHANKGGMIQGFNQGNIVPGIGRRDTVPAMLTPGEFVVNKDATRRNIQTLQAINNGSLIGLNEGGGPIGRTTIGPGPFATWKPGSGPPQFPAYGPSSPLPVDIANVSDQDTAKANKNAAKGGMFNKSMMMQMGIGSLLSIPGMMGGAALGEAVGGDTGAMVGGMAGSMLPFMLPYDKMGAGLKNMMAGRGKGAAAAGKTGFETMFIEKNIGGPIMKVAEKAVPRIALAAFAPMAGAVAAYAAFITATAVVMKKIHDSNQAEYDAGMELADAMTTSASEIKALGKTAKERIKGIDSYLDASESAAIEQEYATKIQKAKTKQEKIRLEQERDSVVAERGNKSRREAVESFYKEEISKAKKRGASEEQLRRLYNQRNISLGTQFQRPEQFEIDKTFGAEFIKGAGEKQFEQFKNVRGTARQVQIGQVSQAQATTMTRMADAAYGMSMSFERMAERDMASKLAQYVLSGTMTQDQAASVAEAIGSELNDLQIGKDIREQLTDIVGVEGGRVKYAPGTVATRLSDENARRVEELRNLTYSRAGAMFTTNPNNTRDIASLYATSVLYGSGAFTPSSALPALATQGSRTFDEEAFRQGAPTQLNIFSQFFSGMADEFRRNVGSLIELQSSEIQMLEENIAAVGLNYQDLIANAKSLEEAERLRLERARAMTNLQERLDEARMKQMQTMYGTANEEAISRILEPYRNRVERVQAADTRTAASRQRMREIDPITFENFFPNIGERIVGGLDLLWRNISGGFESLALIIPNQFQKLVPSGMAELVTRESREALVKRSEGTALQPQLALFEEIFKRQAETPIMGRLYNAMLNDDEFAAAFLSGINSAMSKVDQAAAAGEIDFQAPQILLSHLEDFVIDPQLGLPEGTIQEYAELLGILDPQQITDVTNAFTKFGENKGLEMQGQAMERFMPLFSQIGQLTSIEMPGLGGKTLIDSILGNTKNLELLGTNDEAMENLMRFFTFVAELPNELQVGFLEDKTITEMIKAGKQLNNFNPKKFISSVKEIKSILKDGISLEGQEIDDGVRLIELSLNRLNEIEDPEIKASLQAEISPMVYEMLRLLREIPGASSAADAKDLFDRAMLLQDEITAATNASIEEDTPKKKKTGGGGGGRENPLYQTLRDLRDQIHLNEKMGLQIIGANETAKGIFDQFRGKPGLNESVIDYLKTLSPEDAIMVGEDLLKNRKKLNSLMALIAQDSIAQQREAANVAKAQRQQMQFLTDSKVVGQMSAIFGSEALSDPEFLQGMMDARGAKNPNKAQKRFLKEYNARKKEERKIMIAQMPSAVAGEAQRNRLDQRAQFELGRRGLSQEEINIGMGNEFIRAAIEERIKDDKAIGPKITNAIKDLAASQKTPIDRLNDSIDEILNVYSEVSNIIQAGVDKIEEFNIKPLEEDLTSLQKQNAEYAESQRRLSRSLSDLQEKENDLKEEQSQQEESINDYYDSRIDALEKVDKINKDIANQQKSQLDIASALSRGDIAAAAKAAQDARNQAAEQQRQQALENLRTQKEEEIERFKEQAEENLKNLTIAVNGELLTREEIQGRIDNIDQKIYDNSLLEYDIQQKITVEREKQAKLAEAQQKISRASNVVSRLQGLTDENLSRTERDLALQGIVAEVGVMGGSGAEQLTSFLNQNKETILAGNFSDPAFAQGIASSLNSFLDGFGEDFASFISPENFKVSAADFIPDGKIDLTQIPIEIPDISGLLNTAFSSASTSVQTSLDTLDTQLEEYKQEVITKNPFDTLIEGTKTLKRRAKEFLDMIPKKPGSGGGGKDDEKDKEVKKQAEYSYKVTKGIDVSQSIKDQRDKLRSRSSVQSVGGQKVRVTHYYGLDGIIIPELSKYEKMISGASPGGGGGLYGVEYSRSEMSQYIGAPGFNTGLPYSLQSGLGPGGQYVGSTYGSTPEGPMPGAPGATQVATAASNILKQIEAEMIRQGQDPTTGSGKAMAQGIADGISQGTLELDPENVGASIEQFVKDAVQAKSPAQRMFPVGGDIAEGVVKGITDWFAAPLKFIWSSIESFFKSETGTENGASTKTGIFGGNLIQGLFDGIVTKIPGFDLWTTISSWITGQINGEGQGDDGSGSTKSQPFGISLAEGIWNGLKTKIPGYGLWTTISNWITGALGIGGEEGSEGTGATKANPSGKSLAEGIWDGLKNWFLNETTIGKLGSSIFGWITSAITGKSEDIEDQGGEGTEDNKGIGSLIIDGLTNWAKNTLDLGGFVENMKQKFKDKQAEFEGIGDKIGGWISGKVNSAIDAAKGAWEAAKTKFSYFGGPIKGYAFGGNINYRPPMTPPPGMMFGGKMKKFANGSFVPGIGNTDTVPAMLTPGEFVVRKSVAQTYGPLLNALNSDVFPKMTMTSLMPSSSKTSSDGQVSYNYSINVNVSGSNASPDEIANTVMSKIKMAESRNIRGTRVG